MFNRILSSHSDIRVPIISGIVKIRALGESFFKQLHDQYASPETCARAGEILASFPAQHHLSIAWLIIGRVAQPNKPDKVHLFQAKMG